MKRAVPSVNVEQASGGNPALRNMLQQLVQTVNQQKAISKDSLGVPQQPSGTVVFQNPYFLVTLGASGQAVTPKQASAQGALGAQATVKSTFHQVRCATSISFDAASSVSLYGGDNGTTQTEIVVTNLDVSKSWYFQARSSYDGNTWTAWRTLNGGKPVNGNPNAVLLAGVTGGSVANFRLAGEQQCALAVIAVYNQGYVFPVGGGDLNHLFGLPSPNGFTDTGHPAHGIEACSVNTLGQVSMQYQDGSGNSWQGNTSVLLFGWDPNSTDTQPPVVPVANGVWVLLTMPGGWPLAVGGGICAPGAAFGLPAGYSPANMMAMAGPNSGYSSGNDAHGVFNATVSALTPNVSFQDGQGDNWPASANWFALAWTPEQQVNVQTLNGGTFLVVDTPSGKLCFGMGQLPAGSYIALPTGFAFSTIPDPTNGVTLPTALAFASPAGYIDSGNPMHGIQLCAVDSNGIINLVYEDGEGHLWSGNCNYFVFAWQTS